MFSKVLHYFSGQGESSEIKGEKGKFLKDGASRFFLVLASSSNVVSWLLVISKIQSLPEPVILHYNAYFGIDMTGQSEMVFLLPAAGLLVGFINFILGAYFGGKEVVIARTITATSLLFNLLINLAIAALIFVNKA